MAGTDIQLYKDLLQAAGALDDKSLESINVAFAELQRLISGVTDISTPPDSHSPVSSFSPYIFQSPKSIHQPTWRNEPISCYVAGLTRPKLYLDVVWETIWAWQAQGVDVVPLVMETGRMELILRGWVFKVRYWQVGSELFNALAKGTALAIHQSTLSFSEKDVMRKYSCSQELDFVDESDEPSFRDAYNFIKAWLRARGLCGGLEYDIPQNADLIKLTAELYRDTRADPGRPGLVWEVLSAFFQLGERSFASGPASCLSRLTSGDALQAGYFEVLLTELHGVYQDSIQNHQAADVDWTAILRQASQHPIPSRMKLPHCILVTSRISTTSRIETGELLNEVEQRIVTLKSDLQKINLKAIRLWPARLCPEDTENDVGSYAEVCWVFGLELGSESDLSDLTTPLDRWANTFKKHPFQSKASVAVETIEGNASPSALALKEDTRTWPRARLTEESGEKTAVKYPVIQRKHMRKHSEPPASQENDAVPKQKLRPALDVLNRLKHDPVYNLEDYIIGYMDRYIGNTEMYAQNWSTESSSEEFIPQSRINYFKRYCGGEEVVVWDRKHKIDLIFGSG